MSQQDYDADRWRMTKNGGDSVENLGKGWREEERGEVKRGGEENWCGRSMVSVDIKEVIREAKK